MKHLIGQSPYSYLEMQCLANKNNDGINEFLASVCSDLPRPTNANVAFTLEGEIPNEFIIEVATVKASLSKVNHRKATGPDEIPGWILKEYSNLLASPITAICNSSLREGIVHPMWKSAIAIPVPKKRPPTQIKKDIRPISLTPIISKVFESIVIDWVEYFTALVDIVHKWYEATDTLGTYVRILL